MLYALCAVVGLIAGAFLMLAATSVARGRSKQAGLSKETLDQLGTRLAQREQKLGEAAKDLVLRKENLDQRETRLAQREQKLDEDAKDWALRSVAFEKRIVSLEDFERENALLKRDLRNIDVSLHKLELDRQRQAEEQARLEERSTALAKRYLGEVEKWVGQSITANNYVAQRQRLQTAIEWSREIGFAVPASEEERLYADLKADYEKEVRKALAKEEQARIKAKIREEEARERELKRLADSVEREREAVARALEAASRRTDAQSEELEHLRARLAEVEEKQRAVAQAQITRAGHIYVISNVGSFGEGVFKIGMTRRLDPDDRVAELGDASVPFPFDVHMMLSADDAPALESRLHQRFHLRRINRVNPRKEFFRVSIEEIAEAVREERGSVDYTAPAEALEYRQSESMTEEDAQTVESAFASAEREMSKGDGRDD